MASLYILRCVNGTYYTGSTDDLERRLIEHAEGLGSNYTRKHLPVELVYREDFDSIAEAFAREKQVQNWSRAKKEALIRGDYESLPGLSRSKSASQYGPLDKLGDRDSSAREETVAERVEAPTLGPSTGSGAGDGH